MWGRLVRWDVAEKLPLAANIRWFQLAYGAYLGVMGLLLWRHFTGREALSQGAIVGVVMSLAVITLIFVIYLQNVYRFGLIPDYSKKCRFCNGPVNRYSEFCEHCGADLIAEDKLEACPKCGVDVYEGTKFCPECGALVAKPPKKAKGAKGHKKRREEEEPPGGWDTPIDATTGLPPTEERR